MTALKPPSFVTFVLASIVLGTGALILAGCALYQFIHGHAFTGLKLLGATVCTLGGCCDPLNWLWYMTPCGFDPVVQPTKRARYVWPLYFIGLVIIIVGWLGDGWLFEPPKKP
jgi:hypothetical protein